MAPPTPDPPPPEHPGALCFLAALGVIWALYATAPTQCLPHGDVKYLVLGFLTCWPINVINNGMPLYIATDTNVAFATLASVVAGVAMVVPLQPTLKVVRRLNAAGLVGLVAAAFGGQFVVVGAAVSGACVAAATSIVRRALQTASVADGNFAVVGMALSAIASVALLLLFEDFFAYSLFAVIFGVALLMTPLPQLAIVDEGIGVEAPLIEEAAPPFVCAIADVIYFFHHGLVHAVPGLLPTLALTTSAYKSTLAAATAGAVAGSLFAGTKGDVHALPLAALSLAFILVGPITTTAPTAFFFYAFAFGDSAAITAKTKADVPSKEWPLNIIGAVGACLGAGIVAGVV